jgi:hypothetical protein
MENIDTKFRYIPLGETFFFINEAGEKIEYRKFDFSLGRKVRNGSYTEFFPDDDVQVLHRSKFVLNT